LQHQDPTKPQADAEFIAQLAQFSSLEQLTDIAKGVEKLVANLPANQTT
jgi:flagellar basal-body rod modification protein FlgD